jgi:hypothetical protein
MVDISGRTKFLYDDYLMHYIPRLIGKAKITLILFLLG